MNGAHILVVEDEAAIAEVVEYNLKQEGFSVELVSRGDLVPAALRRRRPDLVLMDLMLPGLDGLELTRWLKRDRHNADLPLIMLTARDTEVDRIVGLELGADDYVTKPFSPRELVLRVKSVLRRRQSGAQEQPVLVRGALRLEADSHRAYLDEEELVLTALEFRLLRLLMQRQGRVQSRASLLRDVWGYAEDSDSRTVDTHIRRLRGKLGPEGENIETVVGVGYRLRSP